MGNKHDKYEENNSGRLITWPIKISTLYRKNREAGQEYLSRYNTEAFGSVYREIVPTGDGWALVYENNNELSDGSVHTYYVTAFFLWNGLHHPGWFERSDTHADALVVAYKWAAERMEKEVARRQEAGQ